LLGQHQKREAQKGEHGVWGHVALKIITDSKNKSSTEKSFLQCPARTKEAKIRGSSLRRRAMVGLAEWDSICLHSVRPRVQTLTPPKKKKKGHGKHSMVPIVTMKGFTLGIRVNCSRPTLTRTKGQL
jgi:hypothetical protein